MIIKRCDNCKRIIKENDRQGLRAYWGFGSSFDICSECRAYLIELIAKSEMFTGDFKAATALADPLFESMKRLKNFKKTMKSKSI